jgi:Cupin-like domain
MATTVDSRVSPSTRVFDADPDAFRLHFNRASFQFQHRLAGHPLFELSRLLELARETSRTRPENLYYDAGNIRVDQRWDQTPRASFSVEEALERIEHCGAWIILHKADKDPEYAALLNQCMGELQDLMGLDLDRVMKVQEIILFVTSPLRVTSYHIDRECNFLLQVRGEKTLSVFDQNDRIVLPEEELERFWSVDHNAAVHKPEHQNRAREFAMTPGTAVHIPVNAPHWVKNHDNVSISVSVNFQFRDRMLANVYRANYALRKLGFHPTPPGRSSFRDLVKSCAVEPAVWLKNVRNGKPPWS